jgi:hypothetical protein
VRSKKLFVVVVLITFGLILAPSTKSVNLEKGARQAEGSPLPPPVPHPPTTLTAEGSPLPPPVPHPPLAA